VAPALSVIVPVYNEGENVVPTLRGVVGRTHTRPLEVLVVRKIGAPTQPELALGAVVEVGGPGEAPPEILLNDITRRVRIPRDYIAAEAARQVEEIRRRQSAYRAGRDPTPLRGRTVILVDDGIATGSTILAALRALRRFEPSKLVLAVPVAPQRALDALRSEADEVLCLLAPEDFGAVGQFYEDFSQTEDAEVIDLLERARTPSHEPDHGHASAGRDPKGTP